jgi:hypothetical protein
VNQINEIRFPHIIPTKRIADRNSVKRVFRHNLGFKASIDIYWITNPK